ncbi:MAG: cytochrome C [Gammaproteobacteria bacterium]|nr:cytochrome C [Gammaproteobacteria bacterium]
MKMKSKNMTFMLYLTAVFGMFYMVVSGTAVAETITGSAHDFSSRTYTGGQICVTCHTPHGSNTDVTDAPLWNHTLTTQTYTLYSSDTLNATVGDPSGASKLCLSCHDGSVAVDSFGGTKSAGNTETLIGSRAVGADGLNNDHPISFVYNKALADADGALFDPATKTVTIGSGAKQKTGTIAAVLLPGGTLECSSCHDVHNTFTYAQTGSRLLRISDAGSKICLSCHDK